MMNKSSLPLLTLAICCLLYVASPSTTAAQDRQLAVAAIDRAIDEVSALLNARRNAGPPSQGEEPATAIGIFQNFGNQPIDIYGFVLDPDSGQELEQLFAVANAQQAVALEMLPGELWVLREGDVLVAEFLAGNAVEQVVNIGHLAVAWARQPQPRQPLSLLTGVFRDFGEQPVQAHRVDPLTGKIDKEPVTTMAASSQTMVSMFLGDVWSFRVQGELIAEYQANGAAVQSVHLLKLRDAWTRQPRPRQPMALTADGFQVSVPRFNGIFINRLPTDFQLSVVYDDPRDGVNKEAELAPASGEGSAQISMYPGMIYRVSLDQETKAEYLPSSQPDQIIDIAALIEAWQRQPEPRSPMTSGEDGFEPGRIALDFSVVDLEGSWRSTAPARRLFKLFNSDLGLSLSWDDGIEWVFVPSDEGVNAFDFAKAFGADGLPVYSTAEREARLIFLTRDKSTLAVTEKSGGGEVMVWTVVRDRSRDPRRSLARSANDPEGIWRSDDESRQKFTLLNEDDGISVTLEDGSQFLFVPAGEDPDRYLFAKSFDIAGFPLYTPSDQEAMFRFLDRDTARLVMGQDEFQLLRDKSLSITKARVRPAIDPEGIWEWGSGDAGFREQFTVFNSEGGVTLSLTDGRELSFNVTDSDPNRYVFSKTFNREGFPVFTAARPGTSIQFVTRDQAELRVAGNPHPITLGRDKSASVRNILLSSLIEDEAWNEWVQHEQGGGTWKRWTAADRAETSIIQGFSGTLFGSQLPSYRGYNITKLDPIYLARQPGVNPQTTIFRVPDDKTREWSMYGTEYRIPWAFHLVHEVMGQSDTTMSAFFSEEERQSSFGLSVNAGPLSGGYSSSTSNINSENKVSVRSSKWAAEYWLVMHKQYAELSDQFLARVRRQFLDAPVPAQVAYESFADFFDEFGTHYSLSTLYGGRAYNESFESASQVRERLTEGWNAGAKGSYKGIEGGASLDVSNAQGSTLRSQNSQQTYSFSGGAGTSFDLWDIGENKKLVPIKVDLRPIYEVVLPKLFKSDDPAKTARINALRARMQKHWTTYTDPNRGDRKVISRGPRAFEIKIDSVKMVTSKEDVQYLALAGLILFPSERAANESERPLACEVHGKITLRATYKGIPYQTPLVAFNVDREKDPPDEYANWTEGNGLPGLSTEPRVYVINPSPEFREEGPDYELADYKLHVDVDLTDDDPPFGYMDETAKRSIEFPFGDLSADKFNTGGSAPSGAKVTVSGTQFFDVAGFGAIEVKYTAREVDVQINQSDGLPRFPDYGP